MLGEREKERSQRRIKVIEITRGRFGEKKKQKEKEQQKKISNKSCNGRSDNTN